MTQFFVCGTWLVHMCDMRHQSRQLRRLWEVTCMWGTNQVYVGHDSFICVTWDINLDSYDVGCLFFFCTLYITVGEKIFFSFPAAVWEYGTSKHSEKISLVLNLLHTLTIEEIKNSFSAHKLSVTRLNLLHSMTLEFTTCNAMKIRTGSPRHTMYIDCLSCDLISYIWWHLNLLQTLKIGTASLRRIWTIFVLLHKLLHTLHT